MSNFFKYWSGWRYIPAVVFVIAWMVAAPIRFLALFILPKVNYRSSPAWIVVAHKFFAFDMGH
jgi:cellulose synthase/poly-beta-1,6-N-acetylglucosamine synthase-like glycosyltransferase